MLGVRQFSTFVSYRHRLRSAERHNRVVAEIFTLPLPLVATREMARPVANSTFNVARLGDVQDGSTHSAELHVVDTHAVFLEVLYETRHAEWFMRLSE